jgi:hypothetical protein
MDGKRQSSANACPHEVLAGWKVLEVDDQAFHQGFNAGVSRRRRRTGRLRNRLAKVKGRRG